MTDGHFQAGTTATQPTAPASTRWGPSLWARIFTGCRSWALQVDLATLKVQAHDGTDAAGTVVVPADAVALKAGRIWSTVVVTPPGGQPASEYKGLPQPRARSLQAVLEQARRLAGLRRAVEDGLAQVIGWAGSVEAEASQWAQRWWPRELTGRWVHSRPALDARFQEARRTPELQTYLRAQQPSTRRALAWWDADLSQTVVDRNQRFLTQEQQRRADFFASVESSPLTAEQVRAVVCFDNRVQVIAAAGSGKTSTMVARAAYAVQHGLVDPERILMLAFNKKAAQELADRVRRRVGARGE